MKNWQFCMLMASIYAAPLQPQWVNPAAVAVFAILSAVMIVKERP
jgi:hypothetical protein